MKITELFRRLRLIRATARSEEPSQVSNIRQDSNEEQPLPHEGHADSGIAYHITWPYSQRAFLWHDRPSKRKKTDPCGVNFRPLATQLRLWLLRQGPVAYFTHDREGRGPLTPTNPYTESGSVLALMYADVMNDTHAFITDTSPVDELDAEMRRARYYSELALLNVRVCEACIKQLLYCTAISTKDYKRASLRGLLVQDCRHCKKGGKEHNISLLGSLANAIRPHDAHSGPISAPAGMSAVDTFGADASSHERE